MQLGKQLLLLLVEGKVKRDDYTCNNFQTQRKNRQNYRKKLKNHGTDKSSSFSFPTLLINQSINSLSSGGRARR